MRTTMVNDLLANAERELHIETTDKAVARLKAKLQQLATARQVVRNLELELTDLKRELEETL
jgi:hypothetical protein